MTTAARRARRLNWFEMILAFLGSLVLLLVLAPLIRITLATPVGDLHKAIIDHEVLRSIAITIYSAFLATFFSAIAGIPLAYLLARKKFVGRSLLLAVIDLPIVVPHSAAGIALLTVIGRNSLIGRIFGHSLAGTVAGISIAMAFVSLPLLINGAREAFAAVPPRLEKAARTLGAPPARVFFTVSLPLAWRGIASAMIMMWARGISEFGAVVIIAYHPMVTPVMVFQRFNDYGLVAARSVAVLLILICVALFVILRALSRSKSEETPYA